ncbi:hypothetical protein JMJ35_005718 [Cladonia borealis]|uniref:Uncharacterized protein n=1 Tax=Cladonia borealis TaxID=184061 RepID=A0AA39R202_9LECA|nr:hypothetical protein JMJ35_005718 [Cladonia borealis]
MDPIYMLNASPGTPLFPVSPERANRQQLPQLAQSPSLPHLNRAQNDPFLTHSRGNSDVQGKVAQFNNLTKEAAQRRKDSEAALKRAVLGREEAEGESRRLREDNRLLRQDVEEGRARERRVGERLEGVMEELQREKEKHTHAQSIYEKEVRRARKEAFKSSSALVKLQEELKSARNKYTLMREEVDVQRRKLAAKEQERFAAECQMMDLREELDKLRQQNEIVEAERDALKTSLKEEEVARIAAEGAIPLPPSREGEEFASPAKRSRHQHRESLKENIDPEATEVEDELLILKEALQMEKRLRLRADDQVHFMKMECQFQCCSCRIAERQGIEYVHDETLAKQMSDMASKIAVEYETTPTETETITNPTLDRPSTPPCQPSQQCEPSEPLTFSPATGTFHKPPSSPKPSSSASPSSQLLPQPRPTTPPPSTFIQPTIPDHTPSFTFPVTPRPLPIPPPRTISHPPPTTSNPALQTTETSTTTTITIPLKSDDFFSPAPATPSGISREAALEQIRQRRGRARSIATGHGSGTPRKVEGLNLRRDISAPQPGTVME